MYRDADQRRKWFRDRYAARRSKAVEILGGKCAKCETTDDLEIDHIDPTSRSFGIGSSRAANCKEETFLSEVSKCQLLCDPCHNLKTMLDNNKTPAKDTHGTLSAYRYCKCDLCKKAHSDYYKAYHKRKSANSSSG